MELPVDSSASSKRHRSSATYFRGELFALPPVRRATWDWWCATTNASCSFSLAMEIAVFSGRKGCTILFVSINVYIFLSGLL